VSHIPNFAVGIVEARTHATAYGDLIVDREGYIAQFSQDINQDDIEFAERVFVDEGLVMGRQQMLDEVTLVPLQNRLSVFDTEEMAIAEDWGARTVTDAYGREHDFREYVEAKLLERSQNHPLFRLRSEAVLEPPWPRYLEYGGTLEQLLQKVVDDGYDPAYVLRFEQQSGKRPAVIRALESLVNAQEAELEGAEAVRA
jgi:hypothetical protein